MIKERPEFSDKYPAIDGIAKGERPSKEEGGGVIAESPGKAIDGIPYHRPERAIRSDVEEILGLDDLAFDSWYRGRESALLSLLNPIRVAVTIPNLKYASEEQKERLDANAYISGLHEVLEEGLEYIQIIKKVRDNQK